MLSGEGNENGEKQRKVQLAKKQLCTCNTLYLNISLPLFCTTSTSNFQKLPSYTFYGENVVRVLFHFFFFTAAHFHLALVAASISHFLTAATRFSSCSSKQKMPPLFFIYRSRSLSLCFSLTFAGRPPNSFFSPSFSCSIFQICGSDN